MPCCEQWKEWMASMEGQAEREEEPMSLGDVENCANSLGFRGLVPLLPHLCPLSVPEVVVCGVYSESP